MLAVVESVRSFEDDTVFRGFVVSRSCFRRVSKSVAIQYGGFHECVAVEESGRPKLTVGYLLFWNYDCRSQIILLSSEF